MDETSEGALSSQSGLETLLSQGQTPAREESPEPLEDPSHIGRFVVLRRVGEGGMGVVFAAYDNELERRVAIKLVRTRVRGNTGARIRREAQALARLSHPNVVHVYEVGSFEDQLFVAMEYITGPTLAEWAKARLPSPTRWRTVLDTYIQVGHGLAAAHAARIVHRDFKPANAIVGEDGRVRVLDFGIARSADPGSSSASGILEPPNPTPDPDHDPIEAHTLDETLALGSSSEASDPLSVPLTQTGALMGTPAYMSPEQFERRPVGPASDQFSFCVALWEALHGQRPFGGDNPAALMIAVLNGQVRSAPTTSQVPAWVDQILLRGLETDPEARWPSMEVLLDALGRDPDLRRRQRLRRAGVATLVTALVAGSVWFASAQRREALIAEQASLEAQRLEAEAAAREIEANAARDRALVEAQASAVHARDTARVLAASDFGDRPEIANALLSDVERSDQTQGWSAAALRALQTPAPKHVFSGHQGRVVYLDVAASGEWLASASFDSSARLWSADGQTVIPIPHPDHVFSIAFDPSSTRLVSACRDGIARVWSIDALVEGHARGDRNPSPLYELRGHTDLLWSASWSAQANFIITSSRDGTARVWSGPDFSEVRTIEVPGNVWWAEIAPDERWAVAGSSWGQARAWSLSDPEHPVIELEGHGAANIGDVHFSPANRMLVTATTEGKIRVFHHDPVEGPSPTPYLTLDHDNEIVRLRFSRDGLSLLSSSRDRRAKLWRFGEDGQLVEDKPKVLALNDQHMAWSSDFSPDGRLAAVGLAGGTTEVWPLEGGPPLVLRGHVADVFRVRFAPDGRTLYTASNDGTVRAWDMDLSRAGRRLEGHRGPVHRLQAAGPVLASGSNDGTVRLWSGFDPGTLPAVPRAPVEIDGLGRASSIAFGGSPHRIALADESSPTIRLWAVQGTLIRNLDQPLVELNLPIAQGVRTLAFDPSATLLAAASIDGHVYMWNLGQDPREAPREAIELTHHYLHRDSVTPLAFSPDGETFVSAGGDRVLRAWSTRALRAASPAQPPPSRVFGGHTSRISDFAFTPDSSRIATASADHTTLVWSLDSPEQPLHMFEYGDMAGCVAFDPSGTLLAVGSSDTKTYLWDLAGGGRTQVLPGAAGVIRQVEFSPAGDYLAAASADGHLRVYPVAGGPSFEFEAEGSIFDMRFVDEGRRIAVAGSADVVELFYLGDLSREALHQRLVDSTEVCLDADLRVEFVGEPRERAQAKAAACRSR